MHYLGSMLVALFPPPPHNITTLELIQGKEFAFPDTSVDPSLIIRRVQL
jgi:hypothetical protein